jgi:hypothetical protein
MYAHLLSDIFLQYAIAFAGFFHRTDNNFIKTIALSLLEERAPWSNVHLPYPHIFLGIIS